MYMNLVLLVLSLFHDECYTRETPKLLPFAAQSFITEGSFFRLFCSATAGDKPLFFQWSKNGRILSNSPQTNHKIEISDDSSLFSIKNVERSDSGNYSCIVRNAFGEDMKFSQLSVKVTPKWVTEPKDIVIKSGDDIAIECRADGEPKPTIKWIDMKGNIIESETLRLKSIESKSLLYECIADNGIDTPLRKKVNIFVSVPAKFDEKYSLIQVKRGESARLKCNASGDQPLTVKWTKDNVKLDVLGGQNFEIFETTTEYGVNSELLLRTTQRTDGTIYKCEAENEHGKDERTIKLVVIEVPGPPMNVRVKEVWSRTASVVWSPPYSGNSPISKYTVQYWRHESAPHRLHELSVTSSQTSALIKDLNPGLSYELNVVGENEVGRGTASDTITFITGEEEPTAPPNDITVESKGPTTIRVMWRSPPIEHWNGVIKGYYVGYRKAHETSHAFTLKLIESKPSQNGKKTEIVNYEYFLRDLMKGTEYAIVVKAYNSAGSGPQSHEMLVHTYDGDLPSAQQLSAIDSTTNSISLRWYQKDIRESQSTPITSYTIHYQRESDPKWKEIPVMTFSTPTPSSDITAVTSHSYIVQNLESGTQYKMFVTAINRYGISDPSNIVVTKTEGDRLILQSEILNPFFEGPHYLQPTFTIPLLTAAVIIIIVLIIAFVCVRKIRRSVDNSGFIMDSTTLNKQFAAYSGTTPRYMDFEKTGGKPLMMTETGNMYPTPYATMPMGGNDCDTNQSWDRPLPIPLLMKRDSHHIYDNPQ